MRQLQKKNREKNRVHKHFFRRKKCFAGLLAMCFCVILTVPMTVLARAPYRMEEYEEDESPAPGNVIDALEDAEWENYASDVDLNPAKWDGDQSKVEYYTYFYDEDFYVFYFIGNDVYAATGDADRERFCESLPTNSAGGKVMDEREVSYDSEAVGATSCGLRTNCNEYTYFFLPDSWEEFCDEWEEYAADPFIGDECYEEREVTKTTLAGKPAIVYVENTIDNDIGMCESKHQYFVLLDDDVIAGVNCVLEIICHSYTNDRSAPRSIVDSYVREWESKFDEFAEKAAAMPFSYDVKTTYEVGGKSGGFLDGISGVVSGMISGEESGEESGKESGTPDVDKKKGEESSEDDEDDDWWERFLGGDFNNGNDGMDGGWTQAWISIILPIIFLWPFFGNLGNTGGYPGRGGYNLKEIPGGHHLSYDRDGDIVGRDPLTGEQTTFVDQGDGTYRSVKTGWEATPEEIAESYDTRERNASYWRQADSDREAGQRMVREDFERDMGNRIREQRRQEEIEKQQRMAQYDHEAYVGYQIAMQGVDTKEEAVEKMQKWQNNLEKWQKQANSYSKKRDYAYNVVAATKLGADIGIDVLSNHTGPAGKAIKNGYAFTSELASSVGEAMDGQKSYKQAFVQGVMKGGLNVVQNQLTGDDASWKRKYIVNIATEGGKKMVDAYGDKNKTYLGEFIKGGVIGGIGTGVEHGLDKTLAHELAEYKKLGYGEGTFVGKKVKELGEAVSAGIKNTVTTGAFM